MPSGFKIPVRQRGHNGTRHSGGPRSSSSLDNGLAAHALEIFFRASSLLCDAELPEEELPSELSASLAVSLLAAGLLLPLLPPTVAPWGFASAVLPPAAAARLRFFFGGLCNTANCSRTERCRGVSSGLSGHLTPQPFANGDQMLPSAAGSNVSLVSKMVFISILWPHGLFKQIACTSLPCNSKTSLLPAAWWKPSTFCVTSRSTQPAASISAKATWPGLGPLQRAKMSLNSLSKAQTLAGSPAKPPMLETSIASYRCHKPSPSRNVGTPLSLEMPAPVNARPPPSTTQSATTVTGLACGAKPRGRANAFSSSSNTSHFFVVSPICGPAFNCTQGICNASNQPSG
mmetsp:Transcript_74863/g.210103  ORF Transcript_74863/g.210103 Transcript_74863/m.210103 type:complete len:345 (-) Transcript_74863:15-1049(-)